MSHWHASSCDKDPITLTGRDAGPHALQDGVHLLALPNSGAFNIRCITGDEAVRRLFNRNKNLPKEAFTLNNIIDGLVRTMKAHETESLRVAPLKASNRIQLGTSRAGQTLNALDEEVMPVREDSKCLMSIKISLPDYNMTFRGDSLTIVVGNPNIESTGTTVVEDQTSTSGITAPQKPTQRPRKDSFSEFQAKMIAVVKREEEALRVRRTGQKRKLQQPHGSSKRIRDEALELDYTNKKSRSAAVINQEKTLSHFPSKSRPEARVIVGNSAAQTEDSDAAEKPDRVNQPPIGNSADKDNGLWSLSLEDSTPESRAAIRIVRPYLRKRSQASIPMTPGSKTASPSLHRSTTEPLTSGTIIVIKPDNTVAATNPNIQKDSTPQEAALNPNTQEDTNLPLETTVATQTGAESEAPHSLLNTALWEDIKAAKETMVQIRDELLVEMKAIKEELRALRHGDGGHGNAADVRADNVPQSRRTTLLFRGLRALRGSELDLD
ncbi:MAG: hypothetical protein Q9209_005836 [Squamulea sp. 1 TL-2023]